MLDRLRVIFGGFDWTNPDDRERAFRSTIPTDALARAFGEWYFVYERSSPDTALSLVSDAYMDRVLSFGISNAGLKRLAAQERPLDSAARAWRSFQDGLAGVKARLPAQSR